jgi:hypothetical protein
MNIQKVTRYKTYLTEEFKDTWDLEAEYLLSMCFNFVKTDESWPSSWAYNRVGMIHREENSNQTLYFVGSRKNTTYSKTFTSVVLLLEFVAGLPHFITPVYLLKNLFTKNDFSETIN